MSRPWTPSSRRALAAAPAAVVVCAVLAGAASAQGLPVEPAAGARPAVGGGIGAFGGSAPPAAAAPGAAPGVVLEPSVSVRQTFTSNAALTDSGGRADSITQVSPGIKLSGRSGRTAGTLDYRLDAVAYARDSDRSELRNFLAAAGTTQLVDNKVFLDASADVSQQTISAFGQQSAGTGLSNDNTTEVATVTIAPRARTRVAGLIDLGADASWTKTRADGTLLGDSTEWDARVQAGARHGIVGWNLAASRQSSDYDDGSRLVTDRAIGTLSVSPTNRLRLFVRGGSERPDYGTSSDPERFTTSGWGLQWQPTPRTQLALQSDERYFGRSHAFTLSHRFRRALLSYSDSRGVSGEDTEALGPFRQAYLRVYTGCMAQWSDVAFCTKFTRAAFGLDPTQSLGFLNNSPSLQRSQALTLAITGLRNSFSLAASRTGYERLDQVDYSAGDLALAPRVRQQALDFTASHRLSPTASLSLGLSATRTLDEPERAGNDQRRIELGLSSDLGARTTGSVSVRHVRFDGDDPYRESALVGSLNHRF